MHIILDGTRIVKQLNGDCKRHTLSLTVQNTMKRKEKQRIPKGEIFFQQVRICRSKLVESKVMQAIKNPAKRRGFHRVK
ncbi:hypothetical protein [Aliiroseovarius crassostreae]|uniref:hypothetical protein n=1 Tax=Aliiroseovarius crassostreae TaxID=154981 RepID=UPI003C7DCF06